MNAIPPLADGSHQTTLTEQLVSLLRRPVDAATRRRAGLHVLDWIGCAALGAASETGRNFRALGAQSAAGSCFVWGGSRVGARDAALINGCFGSLFEMDDTYKTAVLHPGPVVIPAALAAAERTGAGGVAFLDAVVRGYEAMIRLGCSVGAGHYRFYHNTASCGPAGAAVGAGELFGLTGAGLADALGNALTRTGGFWQCRHEPVATKHFHVGAAAHAGFVAAELAAIGFAGPHGILEGEQGFYAATAPDAQPARLVAEPDAAWRIHGTSIKPWPACRHTHAAIDAAILLREQLGGRRIAAIGISTFRDALTFCDRVHPRTAAEARFSLQHAVASSLLWGKPELNSFEADALDDPVVRQLRSVCSIEVAAPYDARYPARFGSAVTVRLADGGEIRAAVDDALGDPENPLRDARVVEKARMLMEAAGLAADRCGDIVQQALGLAGGGLVGGLTAAIERAAASI